MFKRITPQTIADWGERIYIRFLELTKRFTSTQIMALLAIIVGVLAGLGTCLFELLLYGIKQADPLVPRRTVAFSLPVLSGHRYHSGLAFRQIRRQRQHFGRRYTRVVCHVA